MARKKAKLNSGARKIILLALLLLIAAAAVFVFMNRAAISARFASAGGTDSVSQSEPYTFESGSQQVAAAVGSGLALASTNSLQLLDGSGRAAARQVYSMLTEVRDVMAERNLKLSWDGTVIDYLVKKGYSVIYGARNLRRAIQKDVEDAIAAEIVDRRGEKLTEVTLSSDGEKMQIGAK